MERYALRNEQKPWLWAAAGVTALLTVITCIMVISGDISSFSLKISWTTFILFWCGISAYSGAKWLKKNGPLFGLGAATVAISIKAFIFFALMLFGEISSGGFIKYTLVLLTAATTLGYICGIATIRTTHGSIYYLKLFAFCCVAVIGLYYIIILLKIPFFRGFNIQSLYGIMFNNDQTIRILATLVLLAVTLTCIAKSVSRRHEGEISYDAV